MVSWYKKVPNRQNATRRQLSKPPQWSIELHHNSIKTKGGLLLIGNIKTKYNLESFYTSLNLPILEPWDPESLQPICLFLLRPSRPFEFWYHCSIYLRYGPLTVWRPLLLWNLPTPSTKSPTYWQSIIKRYANHLNTSSNNRDQFDPSSTPLTRYKLESHLVLLFFSSLSRF